jgi:hypothetical protein
MLLNQAKSLNFVLLGYYSREAKSVAATAEQSRLKKYRHIDMSDVVSLH